MNISHITRRTFLKNFLSGSTLALAATAGLLKSDDSLAGARPRAAFDSQNEAEAVKSLFGGVSATPSDSIRIEAPLVTGHREAIPISVWTKMENVEKITIVAESNDNPLCSSLTTSGAAGFFSTRIRLSRSSLVTAYVKTAESLYSKSIKIKTIGTAWALINRQQNDVRNGTLTNRTKIRVRNRGNQVEVMVLVKHPMETGWRENEKTGELIPGHYIETMTFELNRRIVAKVDLGPGVATNPMNSIAIRDAKPGDQVGVLWKDNRGQQGDAQLLF